MSDRRSIRGDLLSHISGWSQSARREFVRRVESGELSADERTMLADMMHSLLFPEKGGRPKGSKETVIDVLRRIDTAAAEKLLRKEANDFEECIDLAIKEEARRKGTKTETVRVSYNRGLNQSARNAKLFAMKLNEVCLKSEEKYHIFEVFKTLFYFSKNDYVQFVLNLEHYNRGCDLGPQISLSFFLQIFEILKKLDFDLTMGLEAIAERLGCDLEQLRSPEIEISGQIRSIQDSAILRRSKTRAY